MYYLIGLYALSNGFTIGALSQEDIVKIRTFKVDLVATLDSTLTDLATIFCALIHVRDVQLFLPNCDPGLVYLPHKQTVHSLVAESSTIHSLRGPAPPLYCLSVTIHLEEQDNAYPTISRLFRDSLTKLRIMRLQNPGATFTRPSPVRACLLMDLPHLEYLEIRDLATFVS